MITPYTGRTPREAKHYAEYLRSAMENAERNLSLPAVIWPNGRSSHDVEREVLADATAAMHDFALEHGLWTLDGKIADFA